MLTARFRFYEELNDSLPEEKRKKRFAAHFPGPVTVGDAVESLGVPAGQVDLLLVNGRSAEFSRLLQDGDDIAVYPVFEALDIESVTRLPDRPLRDLRFVLDVHLGKLARTLRLLGIDSLYRNDLTPGQLIGIMQREGRVILTRSRELLEKAGVTHGFRLRAIHPEDQAVEILVRFDLCYAARPLSRCLECNAPLEAVGKVDVPESLPPEVEKNYDRFNTCPQCRKTYWEGSHVERMNESVARILRKVRKAREPRGDTP